MISVFNTYIQYMNEPVQAGKSNMFEPTVTLLPDFAFLTNKEEAQYEALDFFEYHWKENATKINIINLAIGNSTYIYPTPDRSSNFLVVSMGSSSTQAYHVDEGQTKTITYETGTSNLKENELQRLVSDIYTLQKSVLFINSIGFGVPENMPCLVLPALSSSLSNDKASMAIIQLSNLLVETASPNQLRPTILVVSSKQKPKFKNDWTNAFIHEIKISTSEHSFFVDYGGGSISVQHALGQNMDDQALAKFKYDQDAVLDFYTSGEYKRFDIPVAPTLQSNHDMIMNDIFDYIRHQQLNQRQFVVRIRQTGRLRELYQALLAKYVINPLTNRLIQVQGKTYRRVFGFRRMY
ncbi:MAG: hypothetical protein Sylvanvirus12_22 [Sylvanvirus sp.]|uniref:Uncharacterized protein n=1 Tax=Sylvanvirus sp. TaxID=2487774 RepID=A0A3G5AI88_9VIRU|nr:MAG: hypothetical protein Sylvanvirus12_22 [Sylvanvirus sp.]